MVSAQRRASIIELVVCGLLVGLLAVYGLSRMDYLRGATAHDVRMTDMSRTAYVAKNIAEGRGYTTDELPAYLVDYYDQHGKLHQEDWPNADRFPFSAYVVAGLFTITGSTSYELGVLGYNLGCFIGFMVLLYWLAKRVWNDRWSALFALGIALLHPLTYIYLYLKDADMMLLTTAVMAVLYVNFTLPRLTWKRAVLTGTVLAWLFLDRPNIGLGFVLYIALAAARRVWRGRRELRATLLDVLRQEGIIAAAFILWCLPFAIHSMLEWGSPFFSANSIYQLPLGTNFAMDTDTWWKYSEPGHLVTVGTLASTVPSQLLAKFTTSWVMTLKVIIILWAIEIAVALGLYTWWFGRAKSDDAEVPALKKLAAAVGLTAFANFAVLPLYGYQNYPYRHYLSFMLPLLWIGCGRAVVAIGELLRPVAKRALDKLGEHTALVAAAFVVLVVAWNFGSKSQETNTLFANTAVFLGKHWLVFLLAIPAVIFRRFIFRRPAFPRAVIAVGALLYVRYQPYLETKQLNLVWFPADTKVWDVLQQRHGLVMSLAMQGEVNWVSGRRNIPASESPMHAYSLLFDHGLEVEDIYLESADAMVSPGGPFWVGAPGFESYLRLEKYQGRIPGYEIVFHAASMKGDPRYNIKPRAKSSTVYRLVDRGAVAAIGKSPDLIELGKVEDVIHTAYGWGEYVAIDGKPAVAATDFTRTRYADALMKPFEDTTATFFLDERRPKSVDLQIYAVERTTLQFFWNLDLYAYDEPSPRAKHAIGTYKIDHTGWQTVHLDIPAGTTRKGFNKLGFRAGGFQAMVICPTLSTDTQCTTPAHADAEPPPQILRDEHVTTATPVQASLFAGTLEFHY